MILACILALQVLMAACAHAEVGQIKAVWLEIDASVDEENLTDTETLCDQIMARKARGIRFSNGVTIAKNEVCN
jgi:hypothetical protein